MFNQNDRYMALMNNYLQVVLPPNQPVLVNRTNDTLPSSNSNINNYSIMSATSISSDDIALNQKLLNIFKIE